MATTATVESGGGWHAGERAMHQTLLGKRGQPSDNPTYRGLAPSYGYRVQNSPLVAFGALDRAGRPWTTVWGGEAGFCRPVAPGVLGVRGAAVDARYDPVLDALFGGGEGGGGGIRDGEVVRPPDGDGRVKVMAALSIDLETRDRVKLAGRLLAGAVSLTTTAAAAEAQDGEEGGGGGGALLADLQMAFQVTESLGNCPKYLNKKRIVPHVPRPRLVRQERRPGGLPLLSEEAVELIHKADLFFISSKHGGGGANGSSSQGERESMDTNHRGGPAGFVRIFRNDASASASASSSSSSSSSPEGGEGEGEGGGVTLVYPEYSGNRLYQTLGNLQADPAVGLAIPDFATGDVLYATGRATILVGDRAAAYLPPRTRLAVRVDVQEARFVRDGLPFRGSVIDYSPYNPPVRRLAAEKKKAPPESGGGLVGTARLVTREEITPTISRYVFQLSLSSSAAAASVAALSSSSPSNSTSTNTTTAATAVPKQAAAPSSSSSLLLWQPGQHVTLDFGPELDHGWSHMRDDDPQSLNDDFVRTFTISSSSSIRPEIIEFEITARRHGPATGLLSKWNLRVPLDLPVLGFGGEEAFRLPIPARISAEEQEEGMEAEDSIQQQKITSIFVAGGVGITPLMAQASGVLLPSSSSSSSLSNNQDDGGDGGGDFTPLPLKVLWSLRREDLALAVKVVERDPGLGKDGTTTLFVTEGSSNDDASGGGGARTKEAEEQQRHLLARLEDMGVIVKMGRMERDDVLGAAGGGVKSGEEKDKKKQRRRFFCCTGPELMKRLLQWTEGEDVVFESFEY